MTEPGDDPTGPGGLWRTLSKWTAWVPTAFCECHECSALVPDDEMARSRHEQFHTAHTGAPTS